MVLVILAVLVLGAFAYGGWKRRQRQLALNDGSLANGVAPATAAAADIVKDLPAGNMLAGRAESGNSLTGGQLQAPEDLQRGPVGSGAVQPNVYIRQAPSYSAPQAQPVHQPTPEEQRLQAAYDSEQRAIAAPTGLREGFGSSMAALTQTSTAGNGDASSQLVSALQTLSATRSGSDGTTGRTDAISFNPEADSPGNKESFLKGARAAQGDDYLKSMRSPALSEYEIKAGWEIPAVMEQGLNSDLPGEVKALVTANVYDTASGRYVLIPQGARLVGGYNSQLGYGQDGVQVVWNRVIYPDASSLDLSGMIGQDAQGFSGFREKVDHHYKRLVGFAVLSSLFSAASQISQSQNRSVLTYPSPAQQAGSAVGQQASDLGVQITRKNLNVQPTIKISVGYRFNVRVNRDIVFDAPYAPLS
jgi:type IV secretion system protein VirB10